VPRVIAQKGAARLKAWEKLNTVRIRAKAVPKGGLERW